MRKLITLLLLLVPFCIAGAQELNVGTVDAGISGATMRSVLNTNFSNIKTAVDLKAPLTGSAPGLTVGNVSWIGKLRVGTVNFSGVTHLQTVNYHFLTPGGEDRTLFFPFSGDVAMTDEYGAVRFHNGTYLNFPGGHLGQTGNRLGKGWLTDLDVTNTITGSVSGNAATVTGFSRGTGSLTLSGNHALTLTTTAASNITLPTTGTLMTNPMSTSGDLLYGGASGVPTRLGAGTNGHVLTLYGGVPSWREPAAGGVDEGAVTAIAEGVLEDALEDAVIGVAVEDVLGGTTGRDRYMSPTQIYDYVATHGGNGGSFGGGERIKFTVGGAGAPAADDSTFIHTALADKQIDLFRKGVKSEYTYSSGSITVPDDWEAGENVEIVLWPANTWEYLELETSIEAGLISSLVGYWQLDEGTGSTAADEMGNQNLTVYDVNNAWTTGFIGNGIKPSADALARSPGGAGLNPEGPFSVSMWFNLDSLPTEAETLRDYYLYSVIQSSPKMTPVCIRITYDSPYQNLLGFEVRNTSANYYVVRSSSAVSKNTWYNVVASYPGTEGYMKLYLNGQDVSHANVTFGGTITSSDSYVQFGTQERYSMRYVRGVIDEPMYFDRALTLEEAQYLWNNGNGRQLNIP